MTEQEAIKILKTEYLGDSEYMELAKQMGVYALEKQIPKKLIKYDKYYYKCPVCDIDIGVSEEDLTIYEETPPYYCKKCGQALDWGDN